MHLNTRNMAGVESRAQNNETPTTVATVEGGKSNRTKSILHHARHAVCALFLSPVYQSLAAAVCVAGIVLVEVAK